MARVGGDVGIPLCERTHWPCRGLVRGVCELCWFVVGPLRDICLHISLCFVNSVSRTVRDGLMHLGGPCSCPWCLSFERLLVET